MGIEEFEVFSDEAVRESGCNADLIDGEVIMMEEYNPGKVLNIAFDSFFGVVSSAFDVGELVSLEVKVKDLGLMSSTAPHIMSPASCGNSFSIMTEISKVTLNSNG